LTRCDAGKSLASGLEANVSMGRTGSWARSRKSRPLGHLQVG
jgi:hypothetical protein